MDSSNIHEWLEFQETINPKEIDLSLDRVQIIFDKLDINVPKKNVFLIGGTNGKGTTTAIIEQLFFDKGYKTGAYTSPHLSEYNERVRINLENSKDEDWVSAFKVIEDLRGDIPLTYFEYCTLSAFLILSDLNCDAWIIEVGLGGRLDATNIIEPSVSILTSIALDHEEWLGKTIEKIAYEKAGIAKANKPLIYGDDIAIEIIEAECSQVGSELIKIGSDFFGERIENNFSFSGLEHKIESISLPQNWGSGEINNLNSALAAMEANDECFPSENRLQRIIDSFAVPGRFEIFEYNQTWILDVAHNPSAAENLRQRIDRSFSNKTYAMIFSMMKDKHLEKYVENFKDLVSNWVICEMESERSFSLNEIEKKMMALDIKNFKTASNPIDAIKTIEKNLRISDNIIVSGSFELVGPVREYLINSM